MKYLSSGVNSSTFPSVQKDVSTILFMPNQSHILPDIANLEAFEKRTTIDLIRNTEPPVRLVNVINVSCYWLHIFRHLPFVSLVAGCGNELHRPPHYLVVVVAFNVDHMRHRPTAQKHGIPAR